MIFHYPFSKNEVDFLKDHGQIQYKCAFFNYFFYSPSNGKDPDIVLLFHNRSFKIHTKLSSRIGPLLLT